MLSKPFPTVRCFQNDNMNKSDIFWISSGTSFSFVISFIKTTWNRLMLFLLILANWIGSIFHVNRKPSGHAVLYIIYGHPSRLKPGTRAAWSILGWGPENYMIQQQVVNDIMSNFFWRVNLSLLNFLFWVNKTLQQKLSSVFAK